MPPGVRQRNEAGASLGAGLMETARACWSMPARHRPTEMPERMAALHTIEAAQAGRQPSCCVQRGLDFQQPSICGRQYGGGPQGSPMAAVLRIAEITLQPEVRV